MSNPGDYYAEKHREAEDINLELCRHQLDECSGKPECETCKRLEKRLEMARYVGD